MFTARADRVRSKVPNGWNENWDWTSVLEPEFHQPYFQQLMSFVVRERLAHSVFPSEDLTFEAFRRTPLSQVRVVLLGQDPYHGPGQAHGLSFSVPRGMPNPRSLGNIFQERQTDLGLSPPKHGNLEDWAAQGVLLLNAVLTVRANSANSHRGLGWETFTDAVIRCLSQTCPFVVFVLWGKAALRKLPEIDVRHGRICSAHPSPLSARRGFFGSRVFSRCNQALVEKGLEPIRW